jgi:hypothetical protein
MHAYAPDMPPIMCLHVRGAASHASGPLITCWQMAAHDCTPLEAYMRARMFTCMQALDKHKHSRNMPPMMCRHVSWAVYLCKPATDGLGDLDPHRAARGRQACQQYCCRTRRSHPFPLAAPVGPAGSFCLPCWSRGHSNWPEVLSPPPLATLATPRPDHGRQLSASVHLSSSMRIQTTTPHPTDSELTGRKTGVRQ